MLNPSLVTSTISLSPLVNLTSINSSSSFFKVIEINPLFLAVSYSFSGVFLINPCFVAINKNLSSSNCFIGITAVTFSPDSRDNRFTIAVPLDVLPPSGISNPLNLCNLPLFVKNKIISCVEALKICFAKSSSLVVIPIIPFPPLFWLLYVSIGTLLIYPKCVKDIIVCSSFIRSSSANSPLFDTILVFLSSPYFSIISRDSSFIISYTKFSLAKISLKWFINSINCLYSSSIFSRCKPDSVFNLMSRIACACISSRPNLLINFSFGSS